MPRYVAFLRAINVGGHIVKMDRLRALCEEAGLEDVSTFIASGNVLFRSRKAAAACEAAIEGTLQSALGYDVTTMVRTGAELETILWRVEDLEFAEDDGAKVYIGLLKAAPGAVAAKAVAALSNDVDTLAVHGRELYWRCRKSFSQSTIKPGVLNRSLGVAMTTRNLSTVRNLSARMGPRLT